MRDEAIYILIGIIKNYAHSNKDLQPNAEGDLILAGIKALRILGVSSDELMVATTSIMLDDSPLDRAAKGMPKRPVPDRETMVKDLLDLTALNMNKSGDAEK